MQTEESEAQNTSTEDGFPEQYYERHNDLPAFNAGFIDVKGLVAPDPIDRYSIEQFDDGAGFIGFIVEQTATGIAHGVSWVFRRFSR